MTIRDPHLDRYIVTSSCSCRSLVLCLRARRRRKVVGAKNCNLTLVCRCGATALETVGAPISVATCHSESCKLAARRFEQELGVGPALGTAGGVDYALFRKDCVSLLRGMSNLADYRLTKDAPTRRVVATCCNSPMFLDFKPGYWVSLYRSSLPDQAPPPQMRTYTARFFLKLLGAWAAMGFRRPKLSF